MEYFSKNKTMIVLFLEGFVSVALQMIMMRQLVPFVGSSVVVSSLVIGFFLMSLALGYHFGGKVKENQIQFLFKNIFISTILIGFFASYNVLDLAFSIIYNYTTNPVIQVIIVLVLFLCPIVFLLGQTVPLLTNFYKTNSVSQTAGDSFALNTVGSVLGSIITALVFFSYFGIAKTIFISVLLLSIVLCVMAKKENIFQLALFLPLILFATYFINVIYEKEHFVKTNRYTNYQIINNEDVKIFMMNKSLSSGITIEHKAWPYIENIKTILFDHLKITNKEILVLGAGGFTLSHFGEFGNKFTYVDIDKDIQSVAEKFFLNDKIKGDFVPADARMFVKHNKQPYDVILVDLYSSKSSIPWHVLTTEFMIDVKKSTKENGYVVFNIISNGLFADNYSKNIYNTIKHSFNYCSMFSGFYGEGSTNVLYICKNIIEKEHTIYTDDLSRSAIEELSVKH